jgi:hypothetical protein
MSTIFGTGDIGFAAIADGIFTELAEREDNEISNYIEKRGKTMANHLSRGLITSSDVECDDKVKMIDAKFGVVGFGILIKLWQIIYDNSYFTKWTEREVLLYKNRINADINLINDVINECVKWELFNQTTYKKHGVLTSRGIQRDTSKQSSADTKLLSILIIGK